MQVSLRLHGNLRRFSPQRLEKSQLELPPGATVRSMLDALGMPDPAWWMVAVNDRVVDESALLRENDLVEIFDPVAGGGLVPI